MILFFLVVQITVLAGDNAGYSKITKVPLPSMDACLMAQNGVMALGEALTNGAKMPMFQIDMECEQVVGA